MTPDSTDFRACYLHTGRPATRDCINCERPICSLCEEESGDPLLCLPCKEEMERLENSGVDVPFGKDDLRVARRGGPFDVGEVTVLGDGSVIADTVTPAEAGSVEPGLETAGGGTGKEPEEPGKPKPAGLPAESGSGEESPAKVKLPLPPELRKKRPQPPAPASRWRRKPPAPPAGPSPEAGVSRGVTAKAADAVPAETLPARKPAQRPEPAPATVKKPARPKRERRFGDGPAFQVLSGLPYGLAAAVILSGAWLLFAFLAKQWSQVTVMTLGIVVPWAFYKGTTARKISGVRLWKKPPKPAWVAVPSFIIVAALTVPIQLLAFRVIYGSNPAHLPFSDFMDRFFNGLDWALLSIGLVLAFAVPFLLDAGTGWKKPSLKGAEAGSGGRSAHRGEGSDEENGGPGGDSGKDDRGADEHPGEKPENDD